MHKRLYSRVVVSAVTIGIVLRFAVRLWLGESSFLADGYTFYVTLADNLLSGVGLCYGVNDHCALRLPVYPMFLAVFRAGPGLYPWVPAAQAVLGGAAIAITAWIGRTQFDERVGASAAVATAINPYSVVHDTALQDTVVLNLLILAAVAVLIRTRSHPSASSWSWCGLLLGASVLTSGRIALLVPCAVGWAFASAGWSIGSRLRAGLLVALPIVVLVGGWMVRNWVLVGAPVLTTEGGESLYFGNGPLAFAHFPERSIDLNYGEIEHLPHDQQAALIALDKQDVAIDRLYRSWAMAYITAHPGETLGGAFRKLWVSASAYLSPARPGIVQTGYRVVFAPIHVLALYGLWRAGFGRQPHVLMTLVLLSFAVTTAVFWAHTSHKSYLDPLLFVYAAAGVFSRNAAAAR